MSQVEIAPQARCYEEVIRAIPDYPNEGVMFRDITTLLSDHEMFMRATTELAAPHTFNTPDVVAALDARGFIFGGVMAQELGARFVPLRKAGKLPFTTYQEAYDLEYGSAVLEMHTDAIEEGDEVVLVDDLIATGGTAEAAVNLIRRAGGRVVEACFVIDLPDLKGADRLRAIGVPVRALVSYDGE